MSIFLILLYVVFLLYFALRSRGKNSYSAFTIGDKEISINLLFPSLCATFIGPGYSLGFIKNGHEIGFIFFVFAIGYGVQTILTAYFLAPKIQKLESVYSLGDIVCRKHGKVAKLLLGILSFFLMIAFTGIMAKIGGNTLTALIEIELNIAISIITLIVIIYSLFGGIKSSIKTDVFQFYSFVIIFLILLFFVLFAPTSQEINFLDTAINLTQEASSNYSISTIIMLFFSFALGEALVPPYINRALSAKTPEVAKTGFLLSGLFYIFWLLLMLIIGVYCSIYISEPASDDSGILLAEQFFPESIYLIFMISILGIIMSTQDSLLNAGATSLTQDILSIFKKFSQKTLLTISKASTIIIGILAILFSTYVTDIIDSLLWCYKFWAPCVVPVLVASIVSNQKTKVSGTISIVVGFLTAIYLELLAFSSEEITFLATLISTGTLVLGFLIEKRLELARNKTSIPR